MNDESRPKPARSKSAGLRFLPGQDADTEALERSLQHAARDYQDSPWLSGLFRPVLIALVATSFGAGPLAFARAVSTWRMAYALPLLFVVALEGVYITRQLGRPDWRQKRGLVFRVAELVLVLLVVRVAVWLFGTGLPAAADVAGWLTNPAAFADDLFLWTTVIAFLVWLYAGRMTLDFAELGIQADEMLARERRLQLTTSGVDLGGRPHGRADVMQGFMARWISLGILMVFLAALTRLTMTVNDRGMLGVAFGQAGLPGDVLLALLVYFLAGFMLISEGRLAILRGSWYNQDVPVASGVLQRWQVTAFLTLLLVGLVAALLPLGSTAGLSLVLSFVLGLLVRLVYLIVALLIILFGILMLPFRLLLGSGQVELPQPEQVLRQMPTQQEAASKIPPWLGGAIFWVVVIFIVGYLLLTFARTHGGVAGVGMGSAFFERLRFWWRARLARILARAGLARAALRARVARIAPAAPALTRQPGSRGRLIRPGSLPPRARVRYFYLTTLQRAEQGGISRPPHETPLEFAAELRSQVPDAEVDVEALTGAFIDARYSDEPIPGERAQSVQPIWQRVMHALRRGRRS